MSPIETPCETHEQQIQENTREIAGLKERANYKDLRIGELIEDNKRIEAKIDNLTDTVNKVMLNSIKDDNELKQKVLALETKIDTQDKTIPKYKQEAKEQRDEDRAKVNQRLTLIGLGISALSIILAFILK